MPKRSTYFRLFALLAAAAVLAGLGLAQQPKAPPKTRTDNVKETLHGVEIVDAYRWLEDQNSAETRAWIDAENAYTDAVFASLPARKLLQPRLAALMKTDTMTAPVERGGRYFFMKRGAEQDLAVLYMRVGFNGKDEVLIDPHPLSPDHRTSITFEDVSRDGKLMIYGLRQGGEDETALKLFDVEARRELPDVLPRARYNNAAINSLKTLIYYSKHTAEGPRAFVHKVGGNPAADAEIFGKGFGPEKLMGLALSDDGRYLVITILYGSAGPQTEVYYQDLAGRAGIVPLVNDIKARFRVSVAGDRAYVLTDWNAPNWHVLSVDLKNPARSNWRDVAPERSDAVCDAMAPIGGRLFLRYLQNAVSRLEIFEPGGKRLREISFPQLGNVSAAAGRWSGNEAFFSFASFNVPRTIYRYDVQSDDQTVWFQPNVPVESGQFEVKQVWYRSKDGTPVPMFLMHKKGLTLDGASPTLLTGYGGFLSSQTPAFSERAVLWAERGGVFALPNLRGGGEFGETWHRAGMLENKQNVFDDFIAAAQWLVANRYTQPAKLAIAGTSNGGLLVGAALTQRPDLFGAVICGYPLLDMVRYHKFLVARYWVPEYGSSEDAEQFKYIYAYSPYHHVKPGGKYPAVLLISGDSDTRVDPLHARKMTALLQASAASDKPILLHYDTKAGHSGGRPISKIVEDTADELAFLFWQLGVEIR
jgi:prolyl oligopeptidase